MTHDDPFPIRNGPPEILVGIICDLLLHMASETMQLDLFRMVPCLYNVELLETMEQKKKKEERLKSVWQEIYGLHDVSLICYLAN